MLTENLASIKDDMVAFIAGNGLHRMPAYVPEDVPSVMFEEDNPDSWKDFVEHAKAAGASFVTMNEVILEKSDVEIVVEQLRQNAFPDGDPQEVLDAQDLIRYVGKTGYLQLGFAHQGVMFLYETETEWYHNFQQIVDAASEIGRLLLDDEEES